MTTMVFFRDLTSNYSQLRISEPPLGKRKMVRLSEVVRLSGIRISERREKKVRLSEVLQKITGPGGVLWRGHFFLCLG